MYRISVNPDLLRWARERAYRSQEDLSGRPQFSKLPAWEQGTLKPTLKQLEAFARAVHVPIGYLFLPEPPEERLPIPDMRTIGDQGIRHPSPDLLDTIYLMQRRQAWLREERIEWDMDLLDFVGSAKLSDDPRGVGGEMRRIIGFTDGWASRVRTWMEAIGILREAIEALGVITVINGVVGNNTHRKLNVKEFRGFALSDEYAPLIFVNGADSKSAQMFTLAHELTHLWLGESALTNAGLVSLPSVELEVWCNRAAAEFLIPERELREYWRDIRRSAAPMERIARHFKVSPVVAGRRALDLNLLDRETFFAFYQEYMQRDDQRRPPPSGGDFYNTQNNRVGKWFAMQVIRAAKENRISFKEAYDLTGLHGGSFQEYANRLGINLP